MGSLYQYYPNKAALLFRLQERESADAWRSLEAILDGRALEERIFRRVREFLREALAGSRPDLDLATELFVAVVAGVGDRVCRLAPAPAEVRRLASATSGMLCDQLGLR